MANELCYVDAPGLANVYALLAHQGQVWSTVAASWVTPPVVADWANYALALAETPANSGVYVASAPAALPAGTVQVIVRRRTGAEPVPADPALGLGELAWDGAAEVGLEDLATPEAGSGDILVDHDTGGEDALRVTLDGAGVDGAAIRAYLAADYAAGVHTVRGQAATGTDGRWVAPMYLDADDYVLVIAKPGVLRSQAVEVTVA